MTSPSPRSYGKTFDAVAAEYDRHRPTYPDELIDRACEIAGLTRGDRVLEVGCGSGQLTRSLVARGLQVVAIEPGKHLLSLAEKNVASLGQVEFVSSRFEDASLPDSHFRAVFSASAFHWIDPSVGWQRAARALVPGGTLALIQYCGLEEPRSLRDQEAALSTMTRIAPEIAAVMPPPRRLSALMGGVEARRQNVSEVWAWLGSYDVARSEVSRLFRDVRIASVPVLLEQTADELNALFRTTSLYRRLAANQQLELERAFAQIEVQLGRPIRSSTAAVVVTAHRSADV